MADVQGHWTQIALLFQFAHPVPWRPFLQLQLLTVLVALVQRVSFNHFRAAQVVCRQPHVLSAQRLKPLLLRQHLIVLVIRPHLALRLSLLCRFQL
jgi:hypothetical protein